MDDKGKSLDDLSILGKSLACAKSMRIHIFRGQRDGQWQTVSGPQSKRVERALKIESRVCTSCKSSSLRATSRLAQTQCPRCREGNFADGQIRAVS